MDSNADLAWDSVVRSAYLDAMAWADFNASNAIQMRRLPGDVIDQIFGRVNASNTEAWYFTDHLGSVRTITDSSGSSIADLSYDPWGNLTSTPDADADRFQFTNVAYSGPGPRPGRRAPPIHRSE